ncbi:MAG: asparagine synthase-related protein [Novosphingobium sp.]
MLFHGRIDNGPALAQRLGLPVSMPAPALYAAAVRRWGDHADFEVVGEYCTILADAEEVRLARSPWSAPPLCYAHFDGQTVAASVPRAILAAGLPAELDQTRLADNLYFNLQERTRGWYRGMHRVAQGSVVRIAADGSARTKVYYDPGELPEVRLPNDDSYVEAANALLAEATARTMAGAKRPGIMLSGGLDSPLLAVEAMQQLGPSTRLPSFTFAPLDSWQDRLPPAIMGDERPFVRAFAAMHPTLEPHFTQNVEVQFDSCLDRLFAAMGCAPNHLCNFYVYHGVWSGARDAGCDLLLTADFGNQTYSNEARWCYVEYLLTFRWKQLWQALRQRPGDDRPMLRRLAALSLLRIMPAPLRRAVRSRMHPERRTINDLVTLLPDRALAEAAERALALCAVIEHEAPASKRESVCFEYAWRDCEGAEVQQGFEQIYGLRQADVPAYRPLAEFCAGLPTDQFMRDGQSRWLARRMAIGKLPEAQRTNTAVGWHNVDWHERLTPRLDEFRAEAEWIAGQPDIAALVDPHKLHKVIDGWPDGFAFEPDKWMPPAAGMTRAILTSRFIAYSTGRNDRPISSNQA